MFGGPGDYPQQRGRRSAQFNIYPNTEFLKDVFPLQDERIRDFEPHSERFELELKQFFSMGRRRSGRTSILARVIVETALESGEVLQVADHSLNERAQSQITHHLMVRIMDIVEDYKQKGCEIHMSKWNTQSGVIQLYLDPQSFGRYEQLKIENNPSRPIRNSLFDIEALEKQKEFLLKRRLLLLL